MCSVKTTAYDQSNNMQCDFHICKVQKSSKSGQTVQGIVQLGLLLLCTELTLFCTELPENCIYLNQSELSYFFMYPISQKRHRLSVHNFLVSLFVDFWCPLSTYFISSCGLCCHLKKLKHFNKSKGERIKKSMERYNCNVTKILTIKK